LVCQMVMSIVCESAGERGKCFVALSGGTTPHALYHRLAAEKSIYDLPWDKAEVFFGDERDVGQDHVDSNYRMAQRTLLDHIPISPQRVHPMPADADDLSAGAAAYEQTIRGLVPDDGGPAPRFDLILLGMGGDGHTASLFPDTSGLGETEKLIVGHHVPVLGRSRMTFTYPLINAARTVILLVTGPDKAEAVAALLGDDPEAKRRIPAAGVCPSDGKLILVLDADAARLLDPKV